MTDMNQDDDSVQEAQLAIRRISHELKTPLTVVIGFCELLTGDRPDDASIKEFATRISSNAWLLHAAVERLIEELHKAEYAGPPLDNPFPDRPEAAELDLDPDIYPKVSPLSGVDRRSDEFPLPDDSHSGN